MHLYGIQLINPVSLSGEAVCCIATLLTVVLTYSIVVQRMLSTAVPTFITVITKDKDRSVAMATLQSLNEVLKSVKSVIIDEQGHPDAIANAARTVLMQKVGS